MDNNLNHRPFSALGLGDLFSTPDHPDVMLMKTEGTVGTLLQGYSCFSRGTLLPFRGSDGIIPQPEGELPISVMRADPACSYLRRPFSALVNGDIFRTPDSPDVVFMKTGGAVATLLQGHPLFSRGTLLSFMGSDCVILPTEGEKA